MVKDKCACVQNEHAKGTPEVALKVIADHYSGARRFDTPEITDEESLALDLYHDVHSFCMTKAGAR